MDCAKYNCGEGYFPTCGGIENRCVYLPMYKPSRSEIEDTKSGRSGECNRYDCGPNSYAMCLANGDCGCRRSLPPPPDIKGGLCSKNLDCKAFQLPHGEYIECEGSRGCRYRKDFGVPPRGKGARSCQGDLDCRRYSCGEGENIGCPVDEIGDTGTCQCLSKMSVAPLGATVKHKSESDCGVYYCAEDDEHVVCSTFMEGQSAYCIRKK